MMVSCGFCWTLSFIIRSCTSLRQLAGEQNADCAYLSTSPIFLLGRSLTYRPVCTSPVLLFRLFRNSLSKEWKIEKILFFNIYIYILAEIAFQKVGNSRWIFKEWNFRYILLFYLKSWFKKGKYYYKANVWLSEKKPKYRQVGRFFFELSYQIF